MTSHDGVTRRDISIPVAGTALAAWHYRSGTGSGRPCVVAAHGFGATRDSGLEGFADQFARAGLDVVVFDYRGFGASGGEPRQLVDIPGQLHDYRAAVAAARGIGGVDPKRIVLWGVSLAGGHVFTLAAEDTRLAAAIALTPATDGRAAMLAAIRRDGVGTALRTTAAGLRDLLAAARRRDPVLVPLVGHPGEVAALTAPGAHDAYRTVAGPGWRNEVTARSLLSLGRYRPGTRAGAIRCPLLVQIGDLDQTVPAGASAEAASRAPRAEVRHYPCDHLDVYPGGPFHPAVLEHQLGFLTRHHLPG